MELVMRVFSSSHRAVRMTINLACANIMTKEYLSNRHRDAAVGNSDLSTDIEQLHNRFDERLRWGWAIHIDRFRKILIPCGRDQRTETSRVVIMMMRDKNRGDLANVNAGFCQPTRNTIAGIHEIMRAINGQEIR